MTSEVFCANILFSPTASYHRRPLSKAIKCRVQHAVDDGNTTGTELRTRSRRRHTPRQTSLSGHSMKNTCREISHTVPDSVAKNSNQQSIDGDDNGHVHPNCLGRAQAADMVTTESPGLYENMEQCKCQEKKDRYNVMQCNASVIFPVIETPKSLSKKRHV